MRLMTLVAALAVLAVSAAQAQQFAAPALVDSISAIDGFGQQTVNLQSGPGEDADPLTASCGGAVSHAPQIHFFYTSGAHELSFSVASPSPVSLLIADPQGNWHCQASDNDIPSITFAPPRSGRYAIWVGATGQGSAATLTISELDPQS